MDYTPEQEQLLSRLRTFFPGPVLESRLSGVPPAQRAAVLEELVCLGLVEVVAPIGRGRKPRYVLTAQGREEAKRLALKPPPKAPPRPTVKSLAGRVDELAARLDGLERRMGQLEARPRAPRAAPQAGADEPSYEAFRHLAREAYEQFDRAGQTLGLVPIPDLRRALDARVPRGAFDTHLLRLHQEGVVDLMPHHHPASLTEERRRDALQHTSAGLLYFLRWLTS